ncbi:ABC transporter permease subunit [Paenibacillus alginolyticus]|uniref:ABC transporter permease n=1 Tax=Paenibacillus alginolyticus TaxID=59839 RepID=UPI000A04F3D1|nr:ABC transporter permease subunit [Paenibacillus alginolyticus]MCY9669996.1 ABC transporter permease subunit [Paenibacillus alginolyticus]
MVLPLAHVVIFKYIPLSGILIAFKDYNVTKGILGSPWVGMKYFQQFFHSPDFFLVIRNTIALSFYSLVINFPAPIILALMLNEIRNGPFKKIVQMATYAPYFISTVVIVSMLILFLSPHTGFVNEFMNWLGFNSVNFIGEPKYFRSINVFSDLWQGTGYGAILYMAALSGVNTDLYEAAKMDGATRLQKMIHIDIPYLVPTIVILMILSVGNIMRIGFEKIYLLQNPMNISISEVIPTYVYKVGLVSANFSFSSAVGLFNSIVNLLLLLSVNYIARKLSESSLF